MLCSEDYSLRQLREQDLELLLQWRNSDHIRANMYTDHIISTKEHLDWFNRVKDNPAMLYLIFEHRGQPVGLVNFTGIDSTNNRCMWGFYIGESGLPPESGTMMGYLGLNFIFEDKQLRKVSGEVISFNRASRLFFRRLGFTEEGRLRQHALKNGRYVDVILYSILADEWRDVYKSEVEDMLRRIQERTGVTRNVQRI